ncbi:unnamed protein product [Closterium sp. NIES-65]|nr:unnamed protein product [Closterium sp. NIES-65]
MMNRLNSEGAPVAMLRTTLLKGNDEDDGDHSDAARWAKSGCGVLPALPHRKGKKKAGRVKFSDGPSLAKRLGDGAKAGLATALEVGAVAVGLVGAGRVAEGGGAGEGPERVGREEAAGDNLREAGGGAPSGAGAGAGGGANKEVGRVNGEGGGASTVRDGGATDGRRVAMVRGEDEGKGHAVISLPHPPASLEDRAGGLIGPPAPADRGRGQHGGRKKGKAAGARRLQGGAPAAAGRASGSRARSAAAGRAGSVPVQRGAPAAAGRARLQGGTPAAGGHADCRGAGRLQGGAPAAVTFHLSPLPLHLGLPIARLVPHHH